MARTGRPGAAVPGAPRRPAAVAARAPWITWRTTTVDGHRVRYGVVGSGPVRPLPPRLGPAAQRLRPAPSRPWPPPAAGSWPRPCRIRRHPGAARRGADLRRLRRLGRSLPRRRRPRRPGPGGRPLDGRRGLDGVRAPPPGRVGSLLLANAIGGPTWALFPNEVRTMVQRPFWDWGRHFGKDLLQSPRDLRMLPTLLEDFIPNLVRNPLGMVRTGEFIRKADLVAEVRRHRRPGDPGDGGVVRPRRPRAPLGLRRPATGRRGRGRGGRGFPRLADRRARAASASWPSARSSTPGPAGTVRRRAHPGWRLGRSGRRVGPPGARG